MVFRAVAGTAADAQAADSEMVAREQRAHVQLLRERDRRPVVVFSLIVLLSVARARLGDHVQRGRRVAALTPFTGKAERPLRCGESLVHAIAGEIGLP